jgi:hypothetical protein
MKIHGTAFEVAALFALTRTVALSPIPTIPMTKIDSFSWE